MGTGCLRGRARFSQAKGRASPPLAPPVGGAGVHAALVENPRDGSAVSCDRLHPRARPASSRSAQRAAVDVGARVGRHRNGAFPRRVSTRPAAPALGPECDSFPFFSFFLFEPYARVEEEEREEKEDIQAAGTVSEIVK